MLRTRRSWERGEGKVGCTLWALVLVVAVMVAWKMVPVKMASANLYDYMEEQAKFAGKAKPYQIRNAILKKAQELNLPVTKEDVKVEKPGDFIKMRVSYMVPVEFPGYTYEWEFEHTVDRAIFIF